ncbi:MAG: hypothetical protein ABWY18_14380 [Tardiphaga sp.]
MPIATLNFIEHLSAPKRAALTVVCAALFGASLTTYVMLMPGNPYIMQVVSSSIKVPALLIICPMVALYPTLFLSRLFEKQLGASSLMTAAFSCIVFSAVFLACCAPVMALLNTLGNYTLVILASYAAFGAAGLAGTIAFYYKLRRDAVRGLAPRSALKISAIWLVLYGVVCAEVGWSIRPLVGWTGQPFEWYRADSVQLWQQLFNEVDNLHVGGLAFPTELEENYRKPTPQAEAKVRITR